MDNVLHAIGRIATTIVTNLVELHFGRPFFEISSNTKDTEQTSSAEMLSICNSSMAAKNSQKVKLKIQII